MTEAQRRALDQLWPRYGVPPGETFLDFAALFGRRAPVTLEIGFGNGAALATMAATHPGMDYLGIEVHRPGVGGLLQRLDKERLTNVRVLIADAKEVLAARVPDATLSAVHVFFPDPWPKLRHHKRRLVQADFVALVRRKLVDGGVFHIATDWQHYAEQMLVVLDAATGLENVAGAKKYAPRGERPMTKFEARGQRLGHDVWDLMFRACRA